MAINYVNYLSYLNNIISLRGQWSEEVRHSDRTCERHHIILRCKGGLPENITWEHHPNIIWLYPKEHYEAHKILYLDNQDDFQISNTFVLMSNTRNKQLTSDEYELMKIASSKVSKKLREGKPGPRLGMRASEETKRKMSEAQKGEKSAIYGKVWMHYLDENEKFIAKDDVDKYLNNGWSLGRCPKIKSTILKEACKNGAGRVHIHKDNIRKMILKKELDHYISDGWQLGRGHFRRSN